MTISIVDLLSRLLEADEREAVRGDLTESGASGGRALRDVVGLVVRRQAALWMDWRPWLALVGVVVPLGLLLSHVSRWWALESSMIFGRHLIPDAGLDGVVGRVDDPRPLRLLPSS